MKKIIKTAACFVSALAVICCAKEVKTGPNEANERYFNAWMEVNHPGLKPTGLGIYVLEEPRESANRPHAPRQASI